MMPLDWLFFGGLLALILLFGLSCYVAGYASGRLSQMDDEDKK